MVSALVPSYVSESVPKSIRGRCTGMVQLANNLGIMLSCQYSYVIRAITMLNCFLLDWVNYGVSKNLPAEELQWRLPLIIQIIPGFVFILCMVWQPESPRCVDSLLLRITCSDEGNQMARRERTLR